MSSLFHDKFVTVNMIKSIAILDAIKFVLTCNPRNQKRVTKVMVRSA